MLCARLIKRILKAPGYPGGFALLGEEKKTECPAKPEQAGRICREMSAFAGLRDFCFREGF